MNALSTSSAVAALAPPPAKLLPVALEDGPILPLVLAAVDVAGENSNLHSSSSESSSPILLVTDIGRQENVSVIWLSVIVDVLVVTLRTVYVEIEVRV